MVAAYQLHAQARRADKDRTYKVATKVMSDPRARTEPNLKGVSKGEHDDV